MPSSARNKEAWFFQRGVEASDAAFPGFPSWRHEGKRIFPEMQKPKSARPDRKCKL
jgi:hypothetical protein